VTIICCFPVYPLSLRHNREGMGGQASQRIVALAQQIHGAIGVTMEHAPHSYTRRAKAGELAFGDANFYREIVAKEMGL